MVGGEGRGGETPGRVGAGGGDGERETGDGGQQQQASEQASKPNGGELASSYWGRARDSVQIQADDDGDAKGRRCPLPSCPSYYLLFFNSILFY
jgi:hypothetical protein